MGQILSIPFVVAGIIILVLARRQDKINVESKFPSAETSKIKEPRNTK
jgi:prolipoprotein diacylglyceryltransferase